MTKLYNTVLVADQKSILEEYISNSKYKNGK